MLSNVVSGESAKEDLATKLRHMKLLLQNKSIQDYVVAGSGWDTQKWIDGIATGNGKVSQFVAMKAGSGYSIESQVTGNDDVTSGIQIEVVSMKTKTIFFTSQAGHRVNVKIGTVSSFFEVKSLAMNKAWTRSSLPNYVQRLRFG